MIKVRNLLNNLKSLVTPQKIFMIRIKKTSLVQKIPRIKILIKFTVKLTQA